MVRSDDILEPDRNPSTHPNAALNRRWLACKFDSKKPLKSRSFPCCATSSWSSSLGKWYTIIRVFSVPYPKGTTRRYIYIYWRLAACGGRWPYTPAAQILHLHITELSPLFFGEVFFFWFLLPFWHIAFFNILFVSASSFLFLYGVRT
jgi:hypothetical protein